jgi:hypothetical protein
MTAIMSPVETLQVKLDFLRAEHERIDISKLLATGTDVVTIRRYRKKKVDLKEQIVYLEGKIYPNITA